MMVRAVLPAACIGWLLGIAWGSLASPVPGVVVTMLGAATVLATAFLVGRRGRLAVAALLSLWLGLLWADRAGRAVSEAVHVWGTVGSGTHRFEGVVRSVEHRGSATVIRLTSVVLDGWEEGLPGVLQATVPAETPIAESARLRLLGSVMSLGDRTPLPGGVARAYQSAGVVATMRYPRVVVLDAGKPSLLTTLREWLHMRIRHALPEPEAGLLSALVLSFDADLSRDVRDAIAAAGLAHIVAISGSHMAILGLLLTYAVASTGLGRRIAGVATIVASVAFLALVGFPASGVRSVLMASFLVWAFLAGRRAAGLRVLLLSAALMTVHNPRILLGDLGFQLSALATWGLLALAPLVGQGLRFAGPVVSLRGVVVATIAANIATMPLIAFVFGRISVAGLLANMLAVPLFPVLLGAGALVAVAGTVSYLGPLISVGAYGAARAFLVLAELAAGLPGSRIVVPVMPPLLLTVLYGGLFLLPLVVAGARARWAVAAHGRAAVAEESGERRLR